MSTINKKPFIKKLLDSMSGDDLVTLQGLMDGEGVQTPLLRTLSIRPFGNRSHITETDLGVHLCDLEIGTSLFRGYLVYNGTYCVLLQFTDFQRIQMFKIVSDKLNYEVVDEYLDINELRSELDDKEESISPSGSTEIVSILTLEDMQTKVTYENLIAPLMEGKDVLVICDLGLAKGSPSRMIGYFRSSFSKANVAIFTQVMPPLDYPLDPLGLNTVVVVYSGQQITNFRVLPYQILDSSQTTSRMAPTYNENLTYNIGDVVSYSGQIWECTANNTTGTWDDANWTRTTIAEAVLGLLNTGV